MLVVAVTAELHANAAAKAHIRLTVERFFMAVPLDCRLALLIKSGFEAAMLVARVTSRPADDARGQYA